MPTWAAPGSKDKNGQYPLSEVRNFALHHFIIHFKSWYFDVCKV